MKKVISILIAGIIAASAMLASGCEKTAPEGANYSFDCALTGNPQSLDPQFAEDVNSTTVIGNLFTGLMKIDPEGKLENAAAQEYSVSEDGLKYTFTLRSDCYWFYDKNEDEEQDADELTPVTAHDFEFAFKRMFNPETHSPHKDRYRCIKNAAEIIKGKADYSKLGVKAISDTQLVFELEYPSAEFLGTLALTPSMPCNEEFFNGTKGRYGLDDRSVASNGAFFVRQWFYDLYGHDNFIYMARNYKNTEFDRIYPSQLNFYIKKSRTEVAESFAEGNSDVLLTFEYDRKQFEECNVNGYFNYTYGIVVNPKNKQYSNENIRKALAYGIDKESFLGELPDDMTAAYGIIPPGISLLNKSYREINSDKAVAYVQSDGSSIAFDSGKAVEYYRKGMDEMNLQSLENIKILVPENYMDTGYLHLVTHNWQTLFGFYIGIEEVPEEDYYSRLESGEYTMALYPLSGNYNNPAAVFEQFAENDGILTYSNKEFSEVYSKIKKLESFNNGVELYGKAENIILNDFLFIPVFYKKEFEVMGSGNHDIQFDPFTKQLNFRYAKYYE